MLAPRTVASANVEHPGAAFTMTTRGDPRAGLPFNKRGYPPTKALWRTAGWGPDVRICIAESETTTPSSLGSSTRKAGIQRGWGSHSPVIWRGKPAAQTGGRGPSPTTRRAHVRHQPVLARVPGELAHLPEVLRAHGHPSVDAWASLEMHPGILRAGGASQQKHEKWPVARSPHPAAQGTQVSGRSGAGVPPSVRADGCVLEQRRTGGVSDCCGPRPRVGSAATC